MNKTLLQRWLPPVLTLIMAGWFLGNLLPKNDGPFAFGEFGRLPVIANGRVAPMDSLARNSLLQLREKQTLNLEPWKSWNENPKIISATEWLANVMLNPAVADGWPVFRVDNPDLISLLKLPEKDEARHSDGKHYSWNQVAPAMDALEQENVRVEKIEASSRTAYENAIVKMHERATLYVTLKNTVKPEDARDWSGELENYERLIPAGAAAVHAERSGQKYDQQVFTTFGGFLQRFDFMASLEPPLVLPPNGSGEWRRSGAALLDAARGVAIDDSIRDYAKMAGALAADRPDDFNAAVREFRSDLLPAQAPALAKARAEIFFNQMEPFYQALVLYVLAGLLAIFSWFNLSETLRRSSVWLLGLAFVIHTTGLIYRMILEGRPPVTNLYSSAIFIGWGAVALGLVLERFHKNAVGAAVSAGMGFITLIIAQNLALDGDTMEMMRAVLDTNFWLATHVVVVTLGYSSTYVAGFLALIYTVRGAFTRTLDEKTGRSLTRMIYGIVCFATLFSFAGTVLGGIWADQSWGRFWGWDPKENGALIIVLWNALILHLRWGGIIKERGLIACALAGNIITSWSWFGVNMLGIGLHSYGFTNAAFNWLSAFVASQIVLIVLVLIPPRKWRSNSCRTT